MIGNIGLYEEAIAAGDRALTGFGHRKSRLFLPLSSGD